MIKLFLYIFFFLNHPHEEQTVKYLFSFGSSGNNQNRLKNPQALSVGSKGNIFIADTGNHRICKFSPDGKLIQSVGGYGWEQEEFDTPTDICAEVGLDVFVADYNNERIQRYDKQLNFISTLESDENLADFGYPNSVALSINGDLFVADNENNRILKIDAIRNELDRDFGGFNEGEGQLEQASRILLRGTELIYIIDTNAKRVLLFDYFGTYLRDIGSGLLKSPQGFAFDDMRRLYIIDSVDNQLFVYNSSGQFEFTWIVEGASIGYLVDIAVFDDRIYLLDRDQSQVHVFSSGRK